MTPEQILVELEFLKDYTNDHGKQVLSVVISELAPYFAVKEPSVIEKVVEKVIEKPVIKPMAGDRRVDERDPMESEQHLAKKLKLVR